MIARINAYLEARLRALQIGQCLAVASRWKAASSPADVSPISMTVLEADVIVLEPGQTPPLGREWIVYGPMTPEIKRFAEMNAGDPGYEEALNAAVASARPFDLPVNAARTRGVPDPEDMTHGRK